MEMIIINPDHHHDDLQHELQNDPKLEPIGEAKKKKQQQQQQQLSMEQYLSFLHSRYHSPLTVNQLNQIISLQGFKKLKTKSVIVEALSKIEKLRDPLRSTLNDDVSSLAFMTLNQVVKDIEELDWQECSVTSTETINSLHYTTSSVASNVSSFKGPMRKKRPMSRSEEKQLTSDAPGSAATNSDNGGSLVTLAKEAPLPFLAVGWAKRKLWK